jgi:hypothetical protein
MKPGQQFDQLDASMLLCPRCRVAQPVRKRLLLCLPEGDKYEYLCAACGSTCGDKIEPPPPPPRLRLM